MKVLICDDHRGYAEGLAEHFNKDAGISQTFVALEGKEALGILAKEIIEVMLLDISFSDEKESLKKEMQGFEILAAVKKEKYPVKVIMLTRFHEDEFAILSLQAGAVGYINKNKSRSDILIEVKRVANGDACVSINVMQHLLQKAANASEAQHKPLSAGEKEVLPFVALGKTDQEIAKILAMSSKTVYTFRMRIKGKLQFKKPDDWINYHKTGKLPDTFDPCK